jgi:hypothetical protein
LQTTVEGTDEAEEEDEDEETEDEGVVPATQAPSKPLPSGFLVTN